MSPEEWPFTSWLHAEAPGAPLRVAVQGKVAASAVSAPLEGAEARVLQEPPAEAQGLLAVRADAALRARPGGSGRPGSHGQDDHEPLTAPPWPSRARHCPPRALWLSAEQLVAGVVVPQVSLSMEPAPTFQSGEVARKGSTKDSSHLRIPKWPYKVTKEEKREAEEA
ncbi:ankyrin repeat domain-containing protein 33B-like [Macaca fascicularis]|uniref:ankyrin repeat domain-containing protein 33B-like n=1 Tax=Macaca fascicularis TaxID=9541 RepID=UPI0032B03A59